MNIREGGEVGQKVEVLGRRGISGGEGGIEHEDGENAEMRGGGLHAEEDLVKKKRRR